MDSKTVLILTRDPADSALYQTFLNDGNADCGFLAVTTAEEALDFCREMVPDCLVVDDSVDVPDFLTTLAGPGGTLPCAVITVVTHAMPCAVEKADQTV
jgi:hypothetical protein